MTEEKREINIILDGQHLRWLNDKIKSENNYLNLPPNVDEYYNNSIKKIIEKQEEIDNIEKEVEKKLQFI